MTRLTTTAGAPIAHSQADARVHLLEPTQCIPQRGRKLGDRGHRILGDVRRLRQASRYETEKRNMIGEKYGH